MNEEEVWHEGRLLFGALVAETPVVGVGARRVFTDLYPAEEVGVGAAKGPPPPTCSRSKAKVTAEGATAVVVSIGVDTVATLLLLASSLFGQAGGYQIACKRLFPIQSL